MKLKLLALTLCIAGLSSADAQDATEAQQAAAAEAAMAQVLEEAETARVEAERARREAQRVAERAREAARAQRELERAERERASARSGEIARERAVREEEMERAREELSRAHRELRNAQREVALAHRELARSGPSLQAIRLPALGDRPVIGVVLGDETGDGVELIGVSPDGPAEAAGLEIGDVMVAINGKPLSAEGAKPEIFAVMETAKPGDPIEIGVLRAGDRLDFTVVAERREPASWQSLVRIPEITTVERIEGGPGERRIVIESTVVPEIDEQALAERMELLERKLADTEIYFHGEGAPHLAGDYEFHVEGFSDIAGHAFDSANIWFGLPQAQGLQFATVNEGLGAYFKTDRGVLVLEAKDGNAYGLEAGDVILEVGGTPVDTPSELMRVLRELEPGDEIELAIKRDRRNRTLNAVMPENRFGLR